jgi:4a-hydroxytetrahydrobiopterin dehydratase
MGEPITATQFHAAAGVDGWRVLFSGAMSFWPSTYAEAIALTAAVTEAVADLERQPDLDLRRHGVFVRTSRADGRLDEVDVEIVRRVTAAATAQGLEPDPAQLQVINIAVAQGADADVRPFWNAALGYDDLGDEDSIDPLRRNPSLWFHELRSGAAGRGRTHIDISLPAEEAEARVRAALAAGGRMADDSHAPEWWTIASPDNHGVDIAGWTDVDG